MDVSGYQGNVDWGTAYANGARFAYIKATEGTGYTNGYFTQQYNGSYDAGMIRGSYHFALPDNSGGATQADYFVDHGGGWSADGKTLPGALDIEYNPYGSTCYGLSQSSMVGWIARLQQRVPRAHRRVPDDLLDHRLVDDLHRQLERVRLDQPAVDRAVLLQRGHAAGRLGLLHLLAERRLRHVPG